MIGSQDARKLALNLAGATEQDHHGRPSFRVEGEIFATLWDEEHMNVMLDEDGIRTAVQSSPDACQEVWWGQRLRAVSVRLRAVEPDMLAAVLADAWEGKSGR
jgi:hypothetical protein